MKRKWYKIEYSIKNTLAMLKRKISSINEHGLFWNSIANYKNSSRDQDYRQLYVTNRVDIIKKDSLPGQNLHDPDAVDHKSIQILTWLMSEGLKKQHRIIDFGCGSLRNARQLIPYLARENYCGLDITDEFYKMGLPFISNKLLDEKRPFFGVISQGLLSELKNKKWDFIIAKAVLPHIPNSELNAFFEQIFLLASYHTKIYIDYLDSLFNIRISPLTYAHTCRRITNIVISKGFQVEILPWTSIKSYHKFIKITKA